MKIINLFQKLPFWGFLYFFIIFFIFFIKPSREASVDTLGSFFPNLRLVNAYVALQAWKYSIISDPKGFTSNWNGHNVCDYTGVYCAPAPDDPTTTTVAGIDLNHADVAGTLPEKLGLLTDLAIFHVNSNRFCGTLPESFRFLRILHELDVSNNLLSGEFPSVVLCLPSLRYLDIRFNKFSGKIPSALFDLQLDALFLNDNKFFSELPGNIGNSPVSVMVLANNAFPGSCIPPGIAKMAATLNEIILMNLGLGSCLPSELGFLQELTVFDVSCNQLVGELPPSMGKMKKLEQLNVAHNKLSGVVPQSICSLPRLENFTFSENYFTGEAPSCLNLEAKDDTRNCIRGRPAQRSVDKCRAFYSHPIVDCYAFGRCFSSPSFPVMDVASLLSVAPSPL